MRKLSDKKISKLLKDQELTGGKWQPDRVKELIRLVKAGLKAKTIFSEQIFPEVKSLSSLRVKISNLKAGGKI